MTGLVQTVLGPIDPGNLGITLPHEHLLVDLIRPYFSEPEDEEGRREAHQPYTLAKRDEIVTDCNRNADNLRLDDPRLAVEELEAFKSLGGRTVVELTSVDIGRHPAGLRTIAETLGLNVVMGCGYYISKSHPADLDSRSLGDLADEMERDIIEGANGTGIKAGIIGELGVDSLCENERKVLRAGAQAQRRTGAAINVHVEFIHNGASAGLAAVEELEKAGADLERVVLSHQDSSDADPEYQRTVLRKGVVLEYDGFGYEMETAAYGGVRYPTDAERIAGIVRLVEGGWERQLLISTDICMKFLLRRYGGHGYGHILETIVPLMRAAGLADETINHILVGTPRRLLTFV